MSLVDLVNDLPARFEAIPDEGSDQQQIVAAMESFRQHLSDIRDAFDPDYDCLDFRPWVTIQTMIEMIERAADNAFDGGDEQDWERLEYSIPAFQFVMTHPAIAEYEPGHCYDDPPR